MVREKSKNGAPRCAITREMPMNPYDPVSLAGANIFPCDLQRARRAVAFGPEIIEAELNLRLFVEVAWHVVEPLNPFVPGFHLDAICDHLQAVSKGQIRNLLINVPPRHMKSLAVGVFW